MNNNQDLASQQYIIIPQQVAEDHRLSPSSKLLFGHMFTTIESKGFCDASNANLAKMLGTSTKTVLRGLQALDKFGYIKRTMIQDANTGFMFRHITSPLS